MKKNLVGKNIVWACIIVISFIVGMSASILSIYEVLILACVLGLIGRQIAKYFIDKEK